MVESIVSVDLPADVYDRFEAEARAQEILFATDDAMEGITAFTTDRDPEFTGR